MNDMQERQLYRSAPAAPRPAVSWGEVATSTAQVLTADLGYTWARGLVFGFDFWAAIQGLIDWDDVRWDPSEEDVRGKHPALDDFRDRAYERFHKAMEPVHRRRQLRQQALATPLTHEQDQTTPLLDSDK